MPTTSGFYPLEIVGSLRPPAQVIQWNVDGPTPSGYRHIESGVYKPFVKLGWRGGFTAQHASGSALDFGQTYVDDAGFYTKTACLTFNLGEVNKHRNSHFYSASGIGQNFKAFNLKLWLHKYTAFSGFEPTMYYLTSKDWRRGFALTSGTTGAQVMPSSLPTTKNWPTNAANETFVSGCYKEAELSNFMYLVAKFPAYSYSLGTYGGLGQDTFTFRVTYDWTNIDANVLPTDL